MRNSWTVNILVVLALVQGIAGLVRAVGWVQIGTDLFGQGVLLLPIVGAIAMARGLIIGGIAALYLLFAVGALRRKTWAKWVCCTAAAINLLLVLGAFIEGAPLKDAIGWSVIPIILLFELFCQTGREEFRFASG
jgi:hypothetical protein